MTNHLFAGLFFVPLSSEVRFSNLEFLRGWRGLRRSLRPNHKDRIELADDDDRLDRFVALLPRDYDHPAIGPFPRFEIGTADNPVAFDAAQPSERMRPSDNRSRRRVHANHPYARNY